MAKMTGISKHPLKLIAVLIAAHISISHSQSYSELQALGLKCLSRDTCQDNLNNFTDIDRSCKCDKKCTIYNDCCIDALLLPKLQTSTMIFTCLSYGDYINTGVYVISQCSSKWNGSNEIKEKCAGNANFTDLLSSAPVTDFVKNITYHNIACAKCNHADLTSLKSFEPKVKCVGLERLTQEQIIGNLSYNKELQMWGVYRTTNLDNETEFFACDITFDIGKDMKNNVRFCHTNLISTCASDWTNPETAKLCSQYVSEVYSNKQGYRNPHCAICNHKTLDEISCKDELLRRQRRSVCRSGWVWDPFARKCRKLVCAIPGRVLVNGRCVPKN